MHSPVYSRLSISSLCIIVTLMIKQTVRKDKTMALVKTETKEENLTMGAFCKSIVEANKKNEAQPDGLVKRFFRWYITIVSSAHKTPHVDWIRKI